MLCQQMEEKFDKIQYSNVLYIKKILSQLGINEAS